MLLKDKVAMVTGAAHQDGIGFAVAKLFTEHGARVALIDLDAQQVAAAATRLGLHAVGVVADVRSEEDCARAAALVHERWGGLHILVNNAGVVGAQRVTDISRQEYDRVMDVNLRGTLHMSQACIPHLGQGTSIVCMASIAAQRGGGLLGGAHYAASKGGITGLMRTMARELGTRGIRVNALNPGVISTPMNQGAFEGAARELITSQIPLGRFGQPQDVAGACLFLASDLSGYITGASLDVNGGLHIH